MTDALYPGATFRGQTIPASNFGETLDPKRVRLIVVHVMEGTLWGTDAWFHNPVSQVSAHFGVGKTGAVLQWVPLYRQAFAEGVYNDVAISIEHEGESGEALTHAQLSASLKLMEWLKEQFDIPLRRTDDPAGRGVITHASLGVPGGDHPYCPGVPITDQFNIALRPGVTSKKGGTTVTVPFTQAQVKVFVAEAGALIVYANDFFKFDHITGTPQIWLNVAASVVAAISHSVNKVAAKKKAS